MQVDEDSAVASAEVDALGEKHGGVAVGIEGEHTVVQLIGAAKLSSTVDEPSEQAASVFAKPLGMPLHTKDIFEAGALHRLHHSIGGQGRDTEQWAGVFDSLVMERIDVDLLLRVQVVQHRSGLYTHAMGGQVSGTLLRMFDRGLYVLAYLAAKGHSQRLDATADAQHGYLPVVGQSGDEQFGQIALGIDTAQHRFGLLAHPQGVVVAAAGK